MFDERLTSIELRLSKIENALKLSAIPSSTASAADVWAKPAVSPVYQPQPAYYEEPKPGNWLGIIAIICFVLAAVFIVKLSIDSGWLTPTRQIGLATLFGIGLIAAGLMLMVADLEYASLLPGAGVIVLYLSVFAAHRYYGLVSFEAAIAATGFVSVLCIWLYVKIKHDVYPITAAIGAYIAPVILGLHADTVFSVYYFLLCSLTFSAISIGVKSRLLTMISAYLAIFSTASVGLYLHDDMLIAIVLALHFLIFSIGTYFYARQTGDTLTQDEAWSFLPVLLIFYAVEYVFIERIHPGLAPWVSLVFAGVLIGLYLSAKQLFTAGEGSQFLVVAFTTLICFHSVYLEILPADVRPWLFTLIMAGGALMPAGASKPQPAFILPRLALMVILAIEYMAIVSHLLDENSHYWLMVAFSAFASLWIVLVFAEDKWCIYPDSGRVLLAAAHVIAVVAFYQLTNGVGSLAVSASWLLYAVCVIVVAFVRRDEIMAKSAVFVLAFAAGKALLYDAASAPTVVRILCLLLTGVALYGSGFFMRKIASWTSA